MTASFQAIAATMLWLFVTALVFQSACALRRTTNGWALEVLGGKANADRLAEKYGFVNKGQIGSLENMYLFALDVEGNGDTSIRYYQLEEVVSDHPSVRLAQDSEVRMFEQQYLRRWSKRYLQPDSDTDPEWSQQWCVNNTGQTGETSLLVDINVEPSWIQGFTGNDILVAVVDDGVDTEHSDLTDNYDSDQSYDYYDGDNNPQAASGDTHGTAVAGLVAMVRTNRVCGVGVAYDAHFAAIRLIVGDTTDAQDASALSHERDSIHIYSNSWGPSDFGFIVMGPATLANRAFTEGAQQGRGALGNIFTWAAGNGGDYYDSCGADGYVNNIYTIPVGAYSQNGAPAVYDERCGAKFTVAYVDNTLSFTQVVSTIPDSSCTSQFSGTSSSTPLVSGVIALTLEANPDLTWRDVMYLVVYTSNSDPLSNASSDDTFFNAAGRKVSHYFGFGAIDGEAMVTRARYWENVPSLTMYNITTSVPSSGSARFNQPFSAILTYSGQNEITYLEQAVVTITLSVVGAFPLYDTEEAATQIESDFADLNINTYVNFIKRGDIQVHLISPAGTKVTLLFYRPYDIVTDGYNGWGFRSVLHWGEDPDGNWTVTIDWGNFRSQSSVSVSDISLALYGVIETPSSVQQIPETCHSACSRPQGCARAGGSQFCDSCASSYLRNDTTLVCISPDECTSPNTVASGYCYFPSSAPRAMHSWSLITLIVAIVFSLVAFVQ